VKLNRWTIVGISFAFVSAAVAASAITPEDKCEADKNKIAGKYAFCRQKAEAKAIKKGEPADYTKCNEKLLDKWAKAEQKAIDKGTACVDSVADTAIQSFVTAHSNAVAVALDGGPLGGSCMLPATGQTTSYGTGTDGDVMAGAPRSFTDNGDGTITDNQTGLMWEKKDASSGGIHHVNNTYTWSSDPLGFGTQMDGTIATVFLAGLNSGGGFAGYTDWRIPNALELLTIIDYEGSGPSAPVYPAFNQGVLCSDVTLPTCSLHQPGLYYWTSTTSPPTNTDAMAVFFSWLAPEGKESSFAARAVRGGS